MLCQVISTNIETKIGLFPDVGASYFLPRLVKKNPSLGLYLALTGDRLKGLDLVKSGIATHYVPSENLEELKKTLVEKANHYMELPEINSIINSFAELNNDKVDPEFTKEDEINRIFDLELELDEIFDKLELWKENGSETESTWATKVLDSLNKASPISLLVTLEQMKRGAKFKSIEEAFNLEAQIVAGYIQ